MKCLSGMEAAPQAPGRARRPWSKVLNDRF
jgi:hypothetical protein